MSFAEQERALFDLLFDQPLRDDFCVRSTAALTGYELDSEELNDFIEIRPDGLKLDARLRADQILVHLCRQFPVTFSLVSSLTGGMELLRQLVNRQTMRCAPANRASRFGSQLQERLLQPSDSISFRNLADRNFYGAILAAELGMAWTGASLKTQALTGNTPSVTANPITADWSNQPLVLASHVAAVLIPQSYGALKTALCPVAAIGLWAHLSQNPTAASTVSAALAEESPTLFISRAYISKLTRCEARIDHRTLELNDGFAPLLQQVNGKNSIQQILQKMVNVGASAQIVAGLKTGFEQLLESSIIESA